MNEADINGDVITSVVEYSGSHYEVTGTPSDAFTDGRPYWVPMEPTNSGYQAVQGWIAAGGVPTVGEAPPVD